MANYHVVKKDSSWVVKKVGADRISGSFGKQNQAEKAAKKFAEKSGGGEVRIHDRHGRIRDSDTISPARDLYPPRERKH